MIKKSEQLQTQRLVLRTFEESDKPQMIDILLDANNKKTYMLPDFENAKQAESLFEKMMRLSRSEHRFVYGISYQSKLIGFLNDVEIHDSTIEIGYVIATEHQRKGFATEAVGCCIDELFRMGFMQVTAGFFKGNIASRRVMEKCGMQKLDFEEDIEYKGALQHCIYYGIENKNA